jgi:hypothetical protein
MTDGLVLDNMKLKIPPKDTLIVSKLAKIVSENVHITVLKRLAYMWEFWTMMENDEYYEEVYSIYYKELDKKE